MSTINRSEDMQLYKLQVPKEEAWTIMNTIGELNTAHFIDLNKGEQPFNLPYANQIKSSEETERRLVYLINECKEYRIKINRPADIEAFNKSYSLFQSKMNRTSSLVFEEIERLVKNYEQFVLDQTTNLKKLQADAAIQKDFYEVLEYCKRMIPSMRNAPPSNRGESTAKGNLVDADDEKKSQFSVQNQENNAGMIQTQEEKQRLLEGADMDIVRVAHIAGSIEAADQEKLKKLIFRATRGKALTYIEELNYDHQVGNQVQEQQRLIYLIIFEEGPQIRNKIQRICDSFMGQRFELPAPAEINNKIADIRKMLAETHNLVNVTKSQIKEYLVSINQLNTEQGVINDVSMLEIYKWAVAKEKAVYFTMNQMKGTVQTLIGYFWSPVDKEPSLREKMNSFQGAILDKQDIAEIEPPTYFELNDFFFLPQLIVDQYGVPDYKELNPATFTAVSFPFLFGVMFGDLGHGSIILMFGLILIMFKDKLEQAGDPTLKTVVKGRYFFALMGFFACYAGLLYNEFFSFPMNLFGTCYGDTPMPLDEQFLYPYQYDNGTEFLVNCSAWGYPREAKNDDGNFCVYPFGMDPVWKLSEYDIQEFNGVKMKLSVILGVMLMELGIICKMVNAKYRGSTIEMIEAIAMFLMLFLLFGMMDILIFAKWLYPTNIDAQAESVVFNKEYFDADQTLLYTAPCVASTDDVVGSYTFVPSQDQITVNSEPQIYGVLIAAALSSGKIDPINGNDAILYLGSGQPGITFGCIAVAALMAPIILCAHPCYYKFTHKESHDEPKEVSYKRANINEQTNSMDLVKQPNQIEKSNQEVLDEIDDMLKQYHREGGDHSFGDIFVHSGIEAIEFSLGTISNTASYLRLWALSLAHSKLCDVFMLLTFNFQYTKVWSSDSFAYQLVGFILLWPVYMTATTCILLMMDCMECFLHDIRLHWVEFNAKFYKGNGNEFVPLSFTQILEQEMYRAD